MKLRITDGKTKFNLFNVIDLCLLFQLIGFVHFSLLVNALMGHWLPPAYLFYNVLFMVTLMWAIHCRESVDAIHIVSYFISIRTKIV